MQALGSIEVVGLVAGIEAADVACKTADISLIGYELTKGGGYVTVKVEGQVGAVNAAIDAAEAAAAKVSRVVSKLVIPRPHPELEQIVFSATTVGCTPPAPDAPAAKRRPSAKTKPGSVPEPEEPAVTEALADEALEDALTEPEPTLVLDEDQEPTVELDPRHAVDLIVETVMREPEQTVNLVPVGPLTNIALALRREPAIAQRVKRVVLMGGAYTRGNSTPAAEFNIFADPEAAAEVFSAGWPVTMVGLDLTHQALADDSVFARLEQIGGPLSDFVVAMLRFFQSSYLHSQGFTYPPVHDPTAVAVLLGQGLVTTERARVDVETQGALTYGMTVTDFEAYRGAHHNGLPANCDVATTLDVAGFWDVMIAAITRLSER